MLHQVVCGPADVFLLTRAALLHGHPHPIRNLTLSLTSLMRDAGVKNIHAYSWLAHARKYLESIAREKTHLVNRKKFGGRASGNWDHHSHLGDHADGCAPSAFSVHFQVMIPKAEAPSIAVTVRLECYCAHNLYPST